MDVELSRVPQRETGHDALRDHAVGVPGAHAAGRRARPRGRGPAGLRQVGARRGRDRARHRRRRCCASACDGRGGGRGAGAGPGRRGAGLREAARRAPTGWTALRALRPARAAGAGRPRRRAARAARRRPTIASKEWVYRQYDQQVGINTLVLPGSDAGVLRIKGTPQRGGGRHRRQRRATCTSIPRLGAAMAVAEAARNVVVRRRRGRSALTDCLNFGSPERPEILWQFAEAVEGIAEACRGARASRWSAATSPSTMRPWARRSCRRRSSAWSGSSTTPSGGRTQWFKAEGDRRRSPGRAGR